MSITLNEQQMNLLKEFRDKDAEFQAASKTLFAMEVDLDNADYKQAFNRYSMTATARTVSACAFAASVAAARGIVSHRGTESTEVSTEPGEIMEGGFADGSNPVSRYAAIDDIIYRYENTGEYHSLSAIEAVSRIVHGEVSNG